MPEEVEASFLNQTIKVFTKVSINIAVRRDQMDTLVSHEGTSSLFFLFSLQIDPASEKSEHLYATLKETLIPVLHELCDKAAEENEDS